PDEPTRAPVTISRSLASIKPAAAAAQPEYELSMETTTGISAPPMEATRCQPKARAMIVMMISAVVEPPLETKIHSRIKDTMSAAALSLCLCGSDSGLELKLPRSL